MKPIYDFIVEPIGNRYNNTVNVSGKELILNTEVFNHQYVNREAIVRKLPIYNPLNIGVGDKVIVHHNLFRRWHNVKGIEKNSGSYLGENEYLLPPDLFYMFNRGSDWVAMPGFTFVKPIKNKDTFSSNAEQPLVGIVKYSDGAFLPTQLVGFSPDDEFEFIVDGERLYRVMNKYINIEYEYKGNEEEYNPSWAESCRRVN